MILQQNPFTQRTIRVRRVGGIVSGEMNIDSDITL